MSDVSVTRHTPWWQSGVLYQIYPLSFCDSDADGNGDLQGIIDRLDHLEWLGVTGIWLSPITVSPNADWGYDVADYCAVQPGLGTMETFDHLVAEADSEGDPGAVGPGPEPHQRSAPLVRRLAVLVDRRQARLVRVGRPRTRRRPPEQLGEQLRRAGVDPGPDHRPVLPAQSPLRATGPQLVERRGPGGVRRHLPLLVRPWRGRIPDRCVQRHRQGRAAAGQSTGRRERRPRCTALRPASGVQRQPTGGPRCHPALEAGGRRLRRIPGPDRRDPGQDRSAGRLLRRRERRTGPGLQLPLSHRPARRRRHAGRRRGHRSTAAPRSVAGVDGVQSRHVAAGVRGGRTTIRARSGWPC